MAQTLLYRGQIARLEEAIVTGFDNCRIMTPLLLGEIKQAKKKTKCDACGAPLNLKKDNCEYCGTYF